MFRSELKSEIKKGTLTIGSWISIGDNTVAEIISNCKYDWIVIDLEHSSISIDKAAELIRIIDLSGVAPFVRVTSNDENQIKRVLDAGAKGIVIPMVNSKDDALKAVSSTKYYPKGIRGVGLFRAQGYGNRFGDYFKWQEKHIVVIVQIEHKDAIPNLEEIFSVDGVDGFLIGPYDLSCSLGVPGDFKSKDYKKSIKEILDKGKKLNCTSGIHIVEPDQKALKQKIIEGFRFIAFSVDIRMLDTAARIDIEHYKKKN